MNDILRKPEDIRNHLNCLSLIYPIHSLFDQSNEYVCWICRSTSIRNQSPLLSFTVAVPR